jgi:SAM-dependent methyltransferase
VARLVRRPDLRWQGLESSVDCLPAMTRILSGGAIVDLETIPQLPRNFDAVLAADTLEHLSDPGRMLRLIHAALPAGGPLLLSVPNIANVYVRLNLLVGRFPYAERGLLDRTHRVFFTRSFLNRLLREAGFHLEREVVSTIPLPLALPGLPRGVLAAAEKLLSGLTRLLPTLLGYQLLAVARRA